MNFITLGTGHGDPSARRCNSALLLQCECNTYLFDAGDAACTQMIRNGFLPSILSGVFVSHMHDDHAGGILSLVKSALKYRRQYPDKQLSVYLPQYDAPEILKQWLGLFFPETLLAQVIISDYHSGLFFEDNYIRVTAIPTDHLARDKNNTPRSYAWKVEGEKNNILITGDLSSDFSDFPANATSDIFYDIIICELTHFNMKSALPILGGCLCGRLIFTHVYDFWDTAEGRSLFQQIRDILPYPVEIAEDGMKFKL